MVLHGEGNHHNHPKGSNSPAGIKRPGNPSLDGVIHHQADDRRTEENGRHQPKGRLSALGRNERLRPFGIGRFTLFIIQLAGVDHYRVAQGTLFFRLPQLHAAVYAIRHFRHRPFQKNTTATGCCSQVSHEVPA